MDYAPLIIPLAVESIYLLLYLVPLVSFLRFPLLTSGTRLVVDEHYLGLSPFVSHFSLSPPLPRFIKELILLMLSPSCELHSFLPFWV